MLPRNSLWGHLERGELVQLLPDVVTHEEWTSLVYSATRIVPPKVRVFLDFTQEFLGPLHAF